MKKHTSHPETIESESASSADGPNGTPTDQWKRSLTFRAASKGKKLANRDWNRRLTLLREFEKFTGENRDELLEQEPMDIHEKYMEWFDDMKKRILHNSAKVNISYVRGFFSHNGIAFPRGCRLPDAEPSRVTKVYEDTDVWNIDEAGNVLGFNNLLPQFLSNLSLRERTVALCLLTSGQDTKDLLELNLDFVFDARGKPKEGRIFWTGSRQKDRIGFKTFIGTEAAEMLSIYVEQERAGAEPDEPLFVKVIDTEKDDDDKIIGRTYGRLEVQDVTNAFAYASKRMGFNSDENPFRPKRLRHIFRTAFSYTSKDSGFVNVFMGHKTSVSDGYLNKSKAQLTAVYSEVEHYLTVFGSNGDQTMVEIRALVKDNVADLKKDLADRDSKLSVLLDRTDKLESEAKWMRKFIDHLVEQIEGRPADEVYAELELEE